MLSDEERNSLREWEADLRHDDPEFIARFSARKRARRWPFARATVLTCLGLSLFLLWAGSSSGALVWSVFAGMFWALWWWSDRLAPVDLRRL